MRRRRAAVRAAVTATGLAALALLFADGLPRIPVVGEPGPWTVVAGPDVTGDAGACWDDPAVLSAITPAVWPPAAVTVQLVEGATRDDAQRVVACLADRAGYSPVRVLGPDD
ncbi:hypothetical protein MHY85_07225 [Cellulomonas sp. ACRRI]|uniref:hypothetical protein n=1 Tax=Cellulomonas sp. ACRRI TaxID=2918188 RepID=UPI001EF2332B|nr:hypothetical protein [Cellulomonas sp. ACRRI]MCG7285763.1 hypothetical protein [Cellulomonas sp. ACRRI]